MPKNDDIKVSDEGVSIGGISSYVDRFKKMEKGERGTDNFDPKQNFRVRKVAERKQAPPTDPNDLPEKITEDNESKVYVHYYKKFGNLDCDDFDNVKGKIASAINRLYSKEITLEECLLKLEKYVTPADMIFEEEELEEPVKQSSVKKVENKINVDIENGAYQYIKGLTPLTNEELDLVKFVSKDSICFSSNGSSIFIAKNPKNADCFDTLFEFDAQEQLVFTMFKDQLGDEHKAKKLVLMSRMLNKAPKKIARKKKENEVL